MTMALKHPQTPVNDACSTNGSEPKGVRIRVMPGRDLSAELVGAWSAIHASDRTLESPFFRPEYTQLVADVRDDVFVGVAFQNDEPVGFFPFQRNAWNYGGPVGGPLTDYQGVAARPGVLMEPRELLKACGLRSWAFNHLIASQRQFEPYCLLEDQSPSINLAGGLPEYLKERRKASKNEFFQTERKARKIQREVGPLRLEFESRDPTLLKTLIDWKTPQYRRTKAPNIFDYDWVLQVIRRLLQYQDPGFAAYFSPLYVNDELLAINFGLRSGDVYHSWMTTYNHNYASYAPGRILLLELVKAAPGEGIRILDMGRGREQFKSSFGNAATPIWEGVVERRPLTRKLRQGWLHAREWVRDSRYANAIRVPWSWIRPLRDWMKYR